MTDDLEREIADTREHLGETVDALAAKLDVKSRAKEADKSPLIAAGVLLAGIVAAKLLWPSRQ
ncbi:MAG: hypothetical protein JWR55_1429 [Aeromicrobium sp.]|jgi:hypothetical protein|nr:hypothetical protein [Aeromicrobium sp.]